MVLVDWIIFNLGFLPTIQAGSRKLANSDLVCLGGILIINLFNKQKRNTDIDERLLKVRSDMETWFASMTAYMRDIENHQKSEAAKNIFQPSPEESKNFNDSKKNAFINERWVH